jgi:hypothetical protein
MALNSKSVTIIIPLHLLTPLPHNQIASLPISQVVIGKRYKSSLWILLLPLRGYRFVFKYAVTILLFY